MPISNKSIYSSSLQSFFRSSRVTILNGENLHLCISGQCVIKTDCLSICQDQINLRMWNSAGLNHVFYGCFFREPPLDNWLACF